MESVKVVASKTPLKAIRQKCLECSNGSSHEVRLCPINDCALYEYRSGHRPAWAAKHYGDSQQEDEDE